MTLPLIKEAPNEIIIKTCEYLSIREIISFYLTNSRYKKLSGKNQVWRFAIACLQKKEEPKLCLQDLNLNVKKMASIYLVSFTAFLLDKLNYDKMICGGEFRINCIQFKNMPLFSAVRIIQQSLGKMSSENPRIRQLTFKPIIPFTSASRKETFIDGLKETDDIYGKSYCITEAVAFILGELKKAKGCTLSMQIKDLC